jgi:hypothetical protein
MANQSITAAAAAAAAAHSLLVYVMPVHSFFVVSVAFIWNGTYLEGDN